MAEWQVVLVSLVASAIRMSVPIILAGLGGTFSERAGIANIGLEGMMLMGAFAGTAGAYLNNPWLGVLFGLLAGALLGLLLAVLTVTFKANQMVTGIGINTFIQGLTSINQHSMGDQRVYPTVEGIRYCILHGWRRFRFGTDIVTTIPFGLVDTACGRYILGILL